MLTWKTFLFRAGLVSILRKEFPLLFCIVPLNFLLFFAEKGYRVVSKILDSNREYEFLRILNLIVLNSSSITFNLSDIFQSKLLIPFFLRMHTLAMVRQPIASMMTGSSWSYSTWVGCSELSMGPPRSKRLSILCIRSIISPTNGSESENLHSIQTPIAINSPFKFWKTAKVLIWN